MEPKKLKLYDANGEHYATCDHLDAERIHRLAKGTQGPTDTDDLQELFSLMYKKNRRLHVLCPCQTWGTNTDERAKLHVRRQSSSLNASELGLHLQTNPNSEHDPKCWFQPGESSEQRTYWTKSKTARTLHKKLRFTVFGHNASTPEDLAQFELAPLSTILGHLIHYAKTNIIDNALYRKLSIMDYSSQRIMSEPKKPSIMVEAYEKLRAAARDVVLDHPSISTTLADLLHYPHDSMPCRHESKIGYALGIAYALKESGSAAGLHATNTWQITLVGDVEQNCDTLKCYSIHGNYARGPYLVLFRTTLLTTGEQFVEAFAQPVHSFELLTPVDSNFERTVLDYLMATCLSQYPYSGRSKYPNSGRSKYPNCIIRKPLGYDLASVYEKNRPDFDISSRCSASAKRYVIEAMGFTSIDYCDRKETLCVALRRLGHGVSPITQKQLMGLEPDALMTQLPELYDFLEQHCST